MDLNSAGRRALARELRVERGWPLSRIAYVLGVKPPAVSRLLRRMRDTDQAESGKQDVQLPARHIRPMSLSDAFSF